MQYATGIFENADGFVIRLTLAMPEKMVVKAELPHDRKDARNTACEAWDVYVDGETFDRIAEDYYAGELVEDFETAYAQRTED